MIRIVDATLNDSNLITELGKITFLQAHGHSAHENDINSYINANFTEKSYVKAFNHADSVFKIIYVHEVPVGYSKVVFNCENPHIPLKNITKLERLYLLDTYHHLKLGYELFNHNVNTSKNQNQLGIWLNVWTENHKAISFYKKLGFEIVGNYLFQISETRANPNYQMFLKY